MDLGTTRFLTFLIVFTSFYVLESIFHYRNLNKSKVNRLGFHFLISVLNGVLVRYIFIVPILLLIKWQESQLFGIRHLFSFYGPFSVLITIFLYDFYNYWWHRLNHRNSFLWKFHKAHHTDIDLDTTTALRFHPGEILLSMLAKFIFIFVWGATFWEFVLFEVLTNAFAIFHHSNLRLPSTIERFLNRLIITPLIHTGHHTITLRTRDANFSTILSLWDKLFGTRRILTKDEDEGLLGLKEGRDNHLSLAAFLKSPFIKG